MTKKYLTHNELDRRLNVLAQSIETYDEKVRALITEVNGEALDLEIREPESWHRETRSVDSGSTGSIEEQFRAEVDRIMTQDREREACLARRLEFARIRFELALEHAGIDPEEVLGCSLTQDAYDQDSDSVGSKYPDDVLRRWIELHALRTELVERNLYLVLINVERYSRARVSRMDLIQEGASALFRAADGFDWRRGLLFRTYAVHWLNQAFRSFLYNFGNTVRVPVYLQKAMKHVRDAVERLGDRQASVEAIAEEADLRENIVVSALGASRSTHSIDKVHGADDSDGVSLRDMLSYDSEDGLYQASMEDFTLQDGVEMALERLNDRERHVIGLRFGLGAGREHTLAEIATLLGVSLERVRQIQVRAIAKMNTPKLRRVVDPYLI